MNPDNQFHLSQLDQNENCPRFFNISSIGENNPRCNINVTMQSPPNQFSETAAAFREEGRGTIFPTKVVEITNTSLLAKSYQC